MELLFVPHLLSALVLLPCAAVWWREREVYRVDLDRADRHYRMWLAKQRASDLAGVGNAVARAMRGAAKGAAKMADVMRGMNEREGDR